MKQTIAAVFEKGTFRPVDPLELPVSEGQTVRLVVETPDAPGEIIALARRVYEGLPEEDVDAIEVMALDRSRFFEDPASA